jgi:hypothetical protein
MNKMYVIQPPTSFSGRIDTASFSTCVVSIGWDVLDVGALGGSMGAVLFVEVAESPGGAGNVSESGIQ